MKKNRYLFVVALTVALLLASCLVSCSQDAPVVNPEQTVYDSLPADSKAAISRLGEVSCVYEQESSRYINGQEITDSYLDKDGEVVPVSFNSWLVAYKTIAPEYLALFDKIECNAKLHNTHGYSIKELSEKETYVEYCEYRFLDSSDYNAVGDLCFIEIRLVCKDINSDGWYAKSLTFDPKMQYEISWLNINVATSERASYDIRSGSAGAVSYEYKYDDDGKVFQKTSYVDGEVTGHIEYEYDAADKLFKETKYDKAGNISLIYIYEYDQVTEKVIKRTKYDADGNITFYNEYEYNSDGYRIKAIGYRASGSPSFFESFDGTSAERVLTNIQYDELGNETSHYEQEFNADGFLTKFTRIFSGTQKYEYEFDGLSEVRVAHIFSNTSGELIIYGDHFYFASDMKDIGSVSYDINGEITSRQETEYNSDGYKTKTIVFYPSGERTENIYDGTSDGRWLGQIKYDETGNITSWWEFEYNSDGYRTKETSFYGSGVVCQESIYDGTAEKKRLKYTSYYADGTKESESEYSPSTGKMVKVVSYNADGSSVKYEFDPTTGKKVRETHYDAEGKEVYSENEVTITFCHTMGTNLSRILDKYIKEFNKLYPYIHIQCEAIGSYDDLRDQISTQIFVGSQPNIAYCYPDHVALYNMAVAVATLDNLIDSKTEVRRADGTTEILGLTEEQKTDFIEGYYNEGKQFGDGLMYTMPLSKSTEVLYYNKTFFDEHGIKVPTTWAEMEQICAQIKAIDPNSIPLGYDSEANWFITMCEQYNSPYTSADEPHYLFDNEQNIEFVKMFRDWYQKGYLITQKLYGAPTSGLFTSTTGVTSYMSIGSSAGATYQRPAKGADGKYPFEVGIATIPQVSESNRKVISQGPSLCIFEKANPQEVVASWLFVKYLTTTVEFQAEFGMASGYVPVLKSVAQNEVYADFLASADGGDFVTALSAKVCLEQEDAYFSAPAFPRSSEAYETVGNLLARCVTFTDDSAIEAAFRQAQAGEPVEIPVVSGLDGAANYISLVYDLSSLSNPEPRTSSDFDVVDTVTINGITYDISWSADTDLISFSYEKNHTVTVILPEECPAMSYKLIATVTNPSGATKEVVIPHSLPQKVADPTYEEIVLSAFQLSENEYLPKEVRLAGRIVDIPTAYSEQYGNITVNIQVFALSNCPIQCYRLSGDGCADLKAGDLITVEGIIKNYKGTIEFDKPTLVGMGDIPDQSATLDAAFLLADGEAMKGTQVLVGTVESIPSAYSEQYGNITVNLAIGDKIVQAYRLTGGADIVVGDVITVIGNIKNYKGTIEFDKGCRYVTGELYRSVKTLLKAYELEEGKALDGARMVKGTIINIPSAYIPDNGNITVNIQTGGLDDLKIQCYRLTGGADLAIGDEITVTGIIKNYKGTIEFEKNCTYTKDE